MSSGFAGWWRVWKGGTAEGVLMEKWGYLSFLTVFSRHKKAFNIFKRLEILKVLIAETIRSIVSCLINLFLASAL